MSHRLQVLGGVSLKSASGEGVGVPRGKSMALVSYLAMHPEGAERDVLARLLWSGGDASKGRHSVRQALSRVRQALGPESLIGSDPVRLLTGLVTVDLAELRQAVRAGEIDRALSVWKGEPFAGLSITEEPEWAAWVGQVRAEANALMAAGLEDAAAAAVRNGSVEDAIRYLIRATELLSGRPEAWHRLIELQTDFGRLRDARTTLAGAWAALEADVYEARLGDLERRVSLGGDPSTAQSENDVLGRESDVAAVSEAWRDALERRTTVIAFQAGPGGGKTRMLREAEAPLVAPGAHVIRVACRPQDDGTTTPFGAAREIIEELSALPGAEDAMVGSVDRLSELGRIPAEELAHPFLDFVASVCRATPVLITLDDVEWIDPESWELLERLIRLRPASALLIIASFTAEQEPGVGPAGDLGTWWERGWVVLRGLRALSAGEVEAAIRLRGWRDEGFVRSLREVLHHRSKGTPAAVFGLLDTMSGAGIRPPPAGSPHLTTPELPRLDELPLADSLLRFYRGRLAQLGPAAEELLSVFGPDTIQLETLSYAARSDPESVRLLLQELEEAGFVVSSGGGYRLAHPDYGELRSKRRPAATLRAPEPPRDPGSDRARTPPEPARGVERRGVPDRHGAPAPYGAPDPFSAPAPHHGSDSHRDPDSPRGPDYDPDHSRDADPRRDPEEARKPEPERDPEPSGAAEPHGDPESPREHDADPDLYGDPDPERATDPYEEAPPPPSPSAIPVDEPDPGLLGPPDGHGVGESPPAPGGAPRLLVHSEGFSSLELGSYEPPRRSLFPPGWRPQPPLFIAIGILGGIIWMIWSLFF